MRVTRESVESMPDKWTLKSRVMDGTSASMKIAEVALELRMMQEQMEELVHLLASLWTE